MTRIVKLFSLYIISLIFLCPVSWASVNNVILERLTVEDGLSQGGITGLYQDNKGYIWLSTNTGLNYYDGYTVRQLPGPNNEFPLQAIGEVFQDNQNNFWIPVLSKGIYRYQPSSNEYQLVLNKDPNNTQLSVYFALETNQDNHIWLITELSAILYNYQTKQVMDYVSFVGILNESEIIYSAKRFGDMLIFNTLKGIFTYQISDKKLTQIPAINQQTVPNKIFKSNQANRIYDVIFHRDRFYWGTNDGVFSLSKKQLDSFLSNNSDSLTYQLIVAGAKVWQMARLNDLIYIGDESGLFELNTATNISRYLFKYHDAFSTVGEPTVNRVMIDKYQQVWLGSIYSGAFIWNPKTEQIQTFSYNSLKANSLITNSVSAISNSKHSPNVLWAGSDAGLNKIDLSDQSVQHFLTKSSINTSDKQGDILSIFEANNGYLWLHTIAGVVIFDPKTETVITPNFNTKTNEWLRKTVLSIYGTNEYIWIATTDGIARISTVTGDMKLLENVENNLSVDLVWNLLPSFSSNPDEVLISTHNELWLFNIESNKAQLVFQKKDSPIGEYAFIDSWVKDENGDIWLAFSGIGLFHLDGKTFALKEEFGRENSELDVNIYGLMKDKDHNLWFSTHGGIYRFEPNTKHFRLFDKKAGISNKEFNSGAYTQLMDGRLAYGGMDGINIFYPTVLSQMDDLQEMNIFLSSVDVLSRKMSAPIFFENDYQIFLNHDDVGVRVDFSAFVYGSVPKPTFSFKFKDGTSIPQTKQNYITFPSLKAGKQVLEVRAKHPITGEMQAPLHITFDVAYAPWASPQAKLFYVFLICVIAYSWHRSRVSRQKELLKAHQQVLYRENRLQLALTGSNSEVWDWKAKNNEIFGKRLSEDLGYDEARINHSFDTHVTLIHPEDKERYLTAWRQFLVKADTESNFECSYRLKTIDNQWLWYKDLGKIVRLDNYGKPYRITGSYTNITDSKVAQERAQYYASAFEQTKDWVLIIDENFTNMRANKALVDVLGWESELVRFSEDRIGLSPERMGFYQEVFQRAKVKGNWRGEDVFTTPEGEVFNVIVNISLSENDKQDVTHFICVMTDITAQKSAENELRYLANYDHLTGLPNRSMLLERISHAIASAERYKNTIAVFFIDLDRFKQVNDSFGHEYGDMLLKEVTFRLTNTLRRDDTVGRIGGDEFVVVLEKFSSNHELSRIAQKIIHTLEQPVELNENTVSIGASIGIALYPDDARNSEELLRNADVAMYHAKQQGRNNFQFFAEHMNTEAKNRLIRESELKAAVVNNEFFNLYQPIIDAGKGIACGVELLMRWNHKGEVKSPFHFIPLAEELGLLDSMTMKAMDAAFKQLSIWRQSRPDFYVSVNFSASHFIDDNTVSMIKALLAAHNLQPNALKVEVTESAFISNPEKAIEVMQQLSQFGVKLALDDFGTGFSSLSYLKQLPLNIIKIDRSFVSGIGCEPTDEAIVDSTLVLAKSLDMYCIAEGVETQQQLDYLTSKGCCFIQGYFYYQPLPADIITAKLIEGTVEITSMP